MSYWTFPDGSVEGEATRVLSPYEVMGGGVWAAEIRQAHERTSEKPTVSKGINWSRSECCPINGEPLWNRWLTPQTLSTACLEWGVCPYADSWGVGSSILEVLWKRSNRAEWGKELRAIKLSLRWPSTGGTESHIRRLC